MHRLAGQLPGLPGSSAGPLGARLHALAPRHAVLGAAPGSLSALATCLMPHSGPPVVRHALPCTMIMFYYYLFIIIVTIMLELSTPGPGIAL